MGGGRRAKDLSPIVAAPGKEGAEGRDGEDVVVACDNIDDTNVGRQRRFDRIPYVIEVGHGKGPERRNASPLHAGRQGGGGRTGGRGVWGVGSVECRGRKRASVYVCASRLLLSVGGGMHASSHASSMRVRTCA